MPQTSTLLLAVLEYLALPATAALFASGLITFLRDAFPVEGAIGRSKAVAALYALVHSPRWTRYTAIILSAALTVVATVLAALVGGREILAAVDPVLAGALAGIGSQLWHARTLSPELPEPMGVDIELFQEPLPFEGGDLDAIEREREADRIFEKMSRFEPLTEAEATFIFPHIAALPDTYNDNGE
jgi:hypothetical protein